ncbi:hypothetical protein ACIQF6_14965 [Kitasatospora sp. NPDC092948]|uniref:hypothetical protein n=1 Tax=Kitasatospora sp. NPDC092948 TaxID=3364088 RepID=UPI00382AAF58
MAYAEKVYKVRNGKPTKQYTWRSRYKKPDGTTGSEPGFPTERTAIEWGSEQEAAIRAGRWIDPDLARALFGEWTRTWMAAKAPRGRTVGTRWELLEAHILPKWEHVSIQSITWFDVENWANSLACDDSTATKCVTLMSQILTGAVDAKRLSVNPLFGRRRSRPAAIRAELDAKERRQEELWAPPEVVLQIARRVGRGDGMHIIATAFSGVRWGESLALRPSSLGERREPLDGDVFTCPVLYVREEVAEYQQRDPATGKALGMVLALEPLKSRTSRRDIDLPPFLAELLCDHVSTVKSEFLFMTASGAHWRRGNFGRQVLRPAADGRKALNATKGHAPRSAWEPIMPNLTMRALRHTHDTFQAQIGVAPALEYEQAGHARPGMKGVYQHPTPEMRQARLKGLQGIFERAMANLGWESVWES